MTCFWFEHGNADGNFVGDHLFVVVKFGLGDGCPFQNIFENGVRKQFYFSINFAENCVDGKPLVKSERDAIV